MGGKCSNSSSKVSILPNLAGVTKRLTGFALKGKENFDSGPSIIALVRATIRESVRVKKLAGSFFMNSLITGCGSCLH